MCSMRIQSVRWFVCYVVHFIWSKQALSSSVAHIVGDQSTIFRTSDGGASWQRQLSLPVTAMDLHNLHFVDAEYGWVVGLGGGSANGKFNLKTMNRPWIDHESTLSQPLINPNSGLNMRFGGANIDFGLWEAVFEPTNPFFVRHLLGRVQTTNSVNASKCPRSLGGCQPLSTFKPFLLILNRPLSTLNRPFSTLNQPLIASLVNP
jgi:hypothetical protein